MTAESAMQVQTTPPQPTSLVARFASRFNVEANKLLSTLKATAFKQPADKQTGRVEEVTNEEMMALLIVADQYGLNPFTREIYAFRDRKRGGIVPIVGIDGWCRIINEHPQFNGAEFGYGHGADGKLDFVECTLYRRDREHAAPVREYLRENKRDTDAWTGMPARMLRHRALIQAARISFGFVGIFDEDEGRAIIEGSATREAASEAPAIATINSTLRKERVAEPEKSADRPPLDLDGAPPEITYARLIDDLRKAKNLEVLDMVAGLFGLIPDEQQRAELDVEYRRLRKELEK